MAGKITKIIKYSIGGFTVLVVIVFTMAMISSDDASEDLLLQYQIAEQNDTSYLNCKRAGFHILVPDDAIQEKVDYTLEQIIEDKKAQWDEITVWAYGYSEEEKIGQGFTKGMKEYSTCREVTQTEVTKNQTQCLTVSPAVVEWIESGLMIDGGGTIRNVGAVKSNDFENVYFVSADLQGPGLEGEADIATFATNNIESGALVLSINSVAKEFSDWFHGDREGAQFYVTMGNDGARASQECAME